MAVILRESRAKGKRELVRDPACAGGGGVVASAPIQRGVREGGLRGGRVGPDPSNLIRVMPA